MKGNNEVALTCRLKRINRWIAVHIHRHRSGFRLIQANYEKCYDSSYLNNNPVITYTERRIIIADDEHSSDVWIKRQSWMKSFSPKISKHNWNEKQNNITLPDQFQKPVEKLYKSGEFILKQIHISQFTILEKGAIEALDRVQNI